LLLSANVPATSASVLATFNLSSNTYIGNKVDRMTLMPGSRVVSAADRTVGSSVTPVQITANQNNYNPGNASHRWNLSTDASRNITGFDLDQSPLLLTHLDGQQHVVYNAGSFDIVLKHQDAASSAENRLICSPGADITLAAGESADIEYSTTLTRWLVFKRGGGSATTRVVEQGFAVSDETTNLATGVSKVTWRNRNGALTVIAVLAEVNEAPTGSTIIVDINEEGVSILSTKLSIDASETDSATAATPAVISDNTIADNAACSIDIDQVGSTTPGKGLKVWIIGTKTA
jgi:hypothetical protein